MALSLRRWSVWSSAFQQKLPSAHCLGVPLMPTERSHSSFRNPRLAAQLLAICQERLTEGRSPATLLRLRTWSAQLFWWITLLLKDSATTDIRLLPTLLSATYHADQDVLRHRRRRITSPRGRKR